MENKAVSLVWESLQVQVVTIDWTDFRYVGFLTLLNKILQPYIETSKYVCKNSLQFVETVKTLKLGPNKKMVSFDVAALFPSIPIGDCTQHIHTLLTQDKDLH